MLKNGKTVKDSVPWRSISYNLPGQCKSRHIQRQQRQESIPENPDRITKEYCLKDVQNIGVNKVFALTYHPDYFKESGFEDIDKNELLHKIWGDCLKCPKFPDCNEVAVIKRIE